MGLCDSRIDFLYCKCNLETTGGGTGVTGNPVNIRLIYNYYQRHYGLCVDCAYAKPNYDFLAFGTSRYGAESVKLYSKYDV